MPDSNMRTKALVVLAATIALAAASRSAEAGCGCDKPPPPPAAIRPYFAPPGGTVTIFDDSLEVGRTYVVRFGWRIVYARAVRRRDLADGEWKVQLPVTVPDVAMGPTAVTVTSVSSGGPTTLVRIPSESFTVLQPAIALAERDGEVLVKCYRAAVGADGTLYLPVSVAGITQRMLFSGLAEGYPLLFSHEGFMIYNAQGYAMELFDSSDQSVVTIQDLGSPDSLELSYDRHEFATYQHSHAANPAFGLDSADRNWHTQAANGAATPHIDHDNLVVAISGRLETGGKPAPGRTEPFDFSIVTAVAGSNGTPSFTTIQWSNECAAEATEAPAATEAAADGDDAEATQEHGGGWKSGSGWGGWGRWGTWRWRGASGRR